jgi:hypothetical protein
MDGQTGLKFTAPEGFICSLISGDRQFFLNSVSDGNFVTKKQFVLPLTFTIIPLKSTVKI